ncbi:hypothetical protein BDF22DRAFT_684991 [Syncephalis plumigaleata]|nr:hypothetical protein BDF22DRAFT_684991 [Syncephalis plumigaleata]
MVVVILAEGLAIQHHVQYVELHQQVWTGILNCLSSSSSQSVNFKQLRGLQLIYAHTYMLLHHRLYCWSLFFLDTTRFIIHSLTMNFTGKERKKLISVWVDIKNRKPATKRNQTDRRQYHHRRPRRRGKRNKSCPPQDTRELAAVILDANKNEVATSQSSDCVAVIVTESTTLSSNDNQFHSNYLAIAPNVNIAEIMSLNDLFDIYRAKGFIRTILLLWMLSTRLSRWITNLIKAFFNISLYCLEVYCRWLIDLCYIRSIRNRIKQW